MTALTDSLDSDSEMQPNEPVKPRRCRKHVWGNKTTRYRMQPIGEPENITTCIRCGRLQDLALSRRGKSSRRLGSDGERRSEKRYGWVKTGEFGGPEAKARAERDISSDPVDRHDLAHPTPHYDCPRCLPISSHSVLRDISSVTGSPAHEALRRRVLGIHSEEYTAEVYDPLIAAAVREAVEPLERQNAELRSTLRWVRSHLRYDPPIIRNPEEVARVIDRALLEGKTDE